MPLSRLSLSNCHRLTADCLSVLLTDEAREAIEGNGPNVGEGAAHKNARWNSPWYYTLEHLDLSDCVGIQDRTLIAVGLLKNLRRLNLNYNRITAIGVGYLAGLSGLEALDLTHCRVKDIGSDALVTKPLRSLVLSETRITDSTVFNIRSIPSLTLLHLADCNYVTQLGLVGLYCLLFSHHFRLTLWSFVYRVIIFLLFY